MPTKPVLRTIILFLSVILAACGELSVTTTEQDQASPPTEEQAAPTTMGDPVVIADGPPCTSPTLGIELLLPSPEWDCTATNDQWLKLTSPLFEVNISNLGRGPFCNSSLDDTCQTTLFYSTDIINLQLYTSGGQAREVFGLAEFPNSEVGVWVAITWQDMANHSLTDTEQMEITRLVSSLDLLNP
jgi:hypothetical protein